MVIVSGEQLSLSIEKIADMYGQGQITDGSFAWRDGMSDWLPIANIPELKAEMPEPIEEDAPQEMDDSMPTAMFRPSMAPAEPKKPAVGPGRSGMGVPIPEPSQSGMTAARRPSAARPDLLQAAVAADPTLAHGGGAPAPMPQQQAPRAPMMQNVGGQLVIPGQKESSLMNLPTAFFMAQLGQPQRKRKLFAVAGVGAVVLIGGAIFAARFFDSKEKDATATSFARLGTCLLGDPLGDKETAGGRARNVQLVVAGIPFEQRSKPGTPAWPARCAAEAHTLAEHAKAAGGAYEGLAASSEVLAKALSDDAAATAGFKEPLEKVWGEAKTAGLRFDKAAPAGSAGAAPGTPELAPAPRPAEPMSDKDFRALPKLLSGNFTLSAVRPEPFPGAIVHFVVDQQDMPDGPHACTIVASDEKIRCSKIPAAAAKLSPGLRLMGTLEPKAKPFYFAGDKGQSGVFRPEGGEQVSPSSMGAVTGASGRASGALFMLARSGSSGVKLLGVPEKGATVERALLSGSDLSSPQVTTGLFWDYIAYKTSPRASPASHLMFRKLPDSASGSPGAAIDVGAIDEATPGDEPEVARKGPQRRPEPAAESDDDRAMDGCRTPEATMVRLRGTKHDYVSFFQADRWSPPVKAPSRGGVFTCRKTEASSVRATPVIEQEKNWASISHVRCNIAGCTPTTVSMKELIPGLVEVAPTDARSVLAADIDGKLMVLWNGGYLGGIRMRLAPAAQIKEAQDTVLIDDRDEANPMKLVTVTDMRLVAASNYAVVFLSTPVGVKVLRIDSVGKVTPLSSQ
jgi:hypothetical protein